MVNLATRMGGARMRVILLTTKANDFMRAKYEKKLGHAGFNNGDMCFITFRKGDYLC